MLFINKKANICWGFRFTLNLVLSHKKIMKYRSKEINSYSSFTQNLPIYTYHLELLLKTLFSQNHWYSDCTNQTEDNLPALCSLHCTCYRFLKGKRRLWSAVLYNGEPISPQNLPLLSKILMVRLMAADHTWAWNEAKQLCERNRPQH